MAEKHGNVLIYLKTRYSAVPFVKMNMYLESIERHHGMSESCYKGKILQTNYMKASI